MGEQQSLVSRLLTVLSDLDWWIADMSSSLAKVIKKKQFAGNFLQRYLIESCRSLEDLKIQVTALLSHRSMTGKGWLHR